MSSVRRFEELEAWQRARDLAVAIFRVTDRDEFRAYRDLARQLRRSARSGMANLAEGFERGGNAEFLRFAAIAKGSNGEVRSDLHLVREAGILSAGECEPLLAPAEAAGDVCGGLMRFLRRNRDGGFRKRGTGGESRESRAEYAGFAALNARP